VINTLSFILADAGDDFGKIIIGIVVMILWGIGALVKMSKTQSEQARRRQEQLNAAIRAQMEAARQQEMAAAAMGQRTGQRMPPPVLQQRQQQGQRRPARVPVPPPLQMRAPVQQQRPQQSRKQQRRRVMPSQQPVATAQTLLEEIPRVLESEIGQGAVAASPARRQAAAAPPMLRLTPQSIRQQFILAEILQPPLALRDQTIL
jgi:hypothetical protein